MNKNGIALIYTILITSLLLALGTGLASIIFSTTASLHAQKEYTYSFYLAEAAIELGKKQLHDNPFWYTDLNHQGDLINWLKTTAKGLTKSPKDGYTLKIVKEYNTPILYGIGYHGKSCAIIKLQNNFFEELE
ncbi:hypothetical protein A2230_04610 [candidate division WOR-1 bacterium RIFOXYA2_FULL_36_21]|uniref:Type 4 fimbrial biogenesis protein PilX N-terminal domain-containing protein n=1 Tax=candidate division WOR-1 bacterium RIFOXYB2_FULL_36_35 TaxID=1802578 RepID=A0A1F4S2K4_UNCSA|nr:MAG: hypothetical protein A2230_04610 [candidate division WOR-1 bacterium RIFOXYA2_FULL_36_21]OGC14675.1 MAG: hypothetical protein A2290_01340 [candidate division WOR-1 bacterium RIFOXYB2_FULL_36_35]OGC19693.1 MAG: hypothetical protein A2282_03065 [candidate division WOR-1 bacterium RIFOXYA12_FULL_36_13]